MKRLVNIVSTILIFFACNSSSFAAICPYLPPASVTSEFQSTLNNADYIVFLGIFDNPQERNQALFDEITCYHDLTPGRWDSTETYYFRGRRCKNTPTWGETTMYYTYQTSTTLPCENPDLDDDGIQNKDDLDAKNTLKKEIGIDQENCSQNFQGNPISIFNGNKVEKATDVHFSSPINSGLSFQRFYNSQANEDSTIGYNWTHNFNIILTPNFGDSDQLVRIVEGSGRGIYFEDNDQDGIFKGAYSENSSIVKNADNNYVWTRHDGSIYIFDQATGFVFSITDHNGNVQSFSYNAQNLLQTVTDQSTGRSLTFHYNTENKISHIEGPVTPAVPDGIWVTYAYDTNGNLTRVEYADDNNGSAASGFEYLYEDVTDPNNLTAKKDLARVVLSTWAYNDNDQAIENINTMGTGVTINYDDPNNVIVTDSYGIQSTYAITEIAGRKKILETTRQHSCGSCSDGIKATQYDPDTGYPTQKEYFNGRIDLFQNYDDNYNPQTLVIAQGLPEENVIQKTYHPVLSTPLTVIEKSLFADALNPDRLKITTFDYDDPNAPGNTDAPNENPTNLVSQKIDQGFTMDTSGNVIPYEYRISFTYNAKGQILSVDGPLDGNEDLIKYTYEPATGNLLSISRPLIGTMTFEYDAAGNVTGSVDVNNIATIYTYDGRNRLVSTLIDGKVATQTYTTAGMIKDFTDRSFRTLSYAYNPKGLLDKITNQAGEYLAYTYDVHSNLIEESVFNSQGAKTRYTGYNYGNPASNTDLSPGKPWKTIVRNQDNTADLETVFHYTHGNLSQVVDPAGGQVDYVYDTLNRVSQTTQKITDTENAVTLFSYDLQNNLAMVTDSNSNQTVYTYDDMGRMVKQVSPDTGTTHFTYDAAGNMTGKKENDGRNTTYSYDILNRLTTIEYNDITQDVILLYDQNINGNGRLTEISDASGSYAITYDIFGNRIRIDKTINSIVYTTSYSYDNDGNLLEITYPDSRTVTYYYDAAGNITQVTTTKNGVTQALADGISYLPFGPIQSMEYGNGLVETKTFDLQYRPGSVELPGRLNLSYGYDPVGNIGSITDILNPSKNKTFTYDKANRLTDATTSQGTFAYSYDPVGNRLSRILNGESQTYTYAPGTNRLSQIDDGSSIIGFTYDENGNTLQKGGINYIYNQNNRLAAVEQNNTLLSEFTYNSQGLRTEKKGGENTLFHYDLRGNLIAESDDNGVVSKAYVYLENQRIAAFETKADQNFTIAVLTDEGRKLNNIKVYVFHTNDTYTGIYATTDEEGEAVIEKSILTAESYKFRVDYLNDHFWSDEIPVSANGATIRINETRQPVTIVQNGSPVPGIKVYLFDENGTYLGIHAVTDANGQVWFNMPEGHQYTFRADVMGSQYFSDPVTIGEEIQEVEVDSQGGILQFTLKQDSGTPLSGIKTYLFSGGGQYLGKVKTTDNEGVSRFNVPKAAYKIRCDYLGYQFWTDGISVDTDTSASLIIPHQDITLTVNKTYKTGSEPVDAIKTYLFSESGTYLGETKTTNASGNVSFKLPQKPYKIRTDYLSKQYWSEPVIWTDPVITVTQGKTALTVTNAGNPLPDVMVYAFNTANYYLGISGSTDTSGRIDFTLPAGDYQFRADWMGSQYWSEQQTVAADQETQVSLSTGGGTIEVTLKKNAETVLNGVKCYLFSNTGAYLGLTQTTDADGKIAFSTGDGKYKVRVDYMGYQFWSDEMAIPGELNQELIIPHESVSITVNKTYGSEIQPLENVKIYLFTESGAYQGIYQTTGETGVVTFDLPQKPYKARADYLSDQYWSDLFNWTDQVIDVEQGEVLIDVVQGGNPLAGVSVYVFNSQDQYLGQYRITDTNGQAGFRLPIGTYKFRADHLNSQYWGTASNIAGTATPVTIDTGGAVFSLMVEKAANQPIQNVKVYAFSESVSYLGLHEQTGDTGTVSFDLADGSYKFRVDYLGYHFWTDVYTLPETSSSVLTIPHQDVSITLNSRFDTTDPIQGVKVYLFTASNAYQGQSVTTDSNGMAFFNLPEQSYKLRADHLSEQYWSDPFTSTDTTITVDYAKAGLHITQAGLNVSEARVYLFTATGSYLGRFGNTDNLGKAEFTLPANTYKFRVDYNGVQHWSDSVTLTPLQENIIDLNLDLLASNVTANPQYGRYDGTAPKKNKLLLASTNSGQVPENLEASSHAAYYFINDHLGTPLMVMDDQGQVVWSAEYQPYGKAQININNTDNTFRFPGQYHDAETGLHYNWHRYYDSETGRYLTSDPIGLSGGINPYTYSHINPISNIDPMGLSSLVNYSGNYFYQAENKRYNIIKKSVSYLPFGGFAIDIGENLCAFETFNLNEIDTKEILSKGIHFTGSLDVLDIKRLSFLTKLFYKLDYLTTSIDIFLEINKDYQVEQAVEATNLIHPQNKNLAIFISKYAEIEMANMLKIGAVDFINGELIINNHVIYNSFRNVILDMY